MKTSWSIARSRTPLVLALLVLALLLAAGPATARTPRAVEPAASPLYIGWSLWVGLVLLSEPTVERRPALPAGYSVQQHQA